MAALGSHRRLLLPSPGKLHCVTGDSILRWKNQEDSGALLLPDASLGRWCSRAHGAERHLGSESVSLASIRVSLDLGFSTPQWLIQSLGTDVGTASAVLLEDCCPPASAHVDGSRQQRFLLLASEEENNRSGGGP